MLDTVDFETEVLTAVHNILDNGLDEPVVIRKRLAVRQNEPTPLVPIAIVDVDEENGPESTVYTSLTVVAVRVEKIQGELNDPSNLNIWREKTKQLMDTHLQGLTYPCIMVELLPRPPVDIPAIEAYFDVTPVAVKYTIKRPRKGK